MVGGYWKKKCCPVSSSSSSSPSSPSSPSSSSTSAGTKLCRGVCLNDIGPQIWRVEINVGNGAQCNTCVNYSGIYYLDAELDNYSENLNSNCIWRKDIGFNCDCPPNTRTSFLEVFVQWAAPNAIFQINLETDQFSMVRWQKTISGLGRPNCCGMDDEAIPWISDSSNMCGPGTGTMCLGVGNAKLTALGC
jgi:hypothetical protein